MNNYFSDRTIKTAQNYCSYRTSSVRFLRSSAIALLLATLLSGCASTSSPEQSVTSKVSGANVIENKKLRTYYTHWSGVPYRFGGTTKSGIDCSAFTQRVYKDHFQTPLPRMTSAQVTIGRQLQVKKEKRKTGDLIFFRTGKNQRHVGIYVGNNRFMHASTSKGVMISNLDNSYWKKAYWQTRRIMPET